MNRLLKTLYILVLTTLLATACSPEDGHTRTKQQNKMQIIEYQSVLGKSIQDQEVANFISRNYCSGATQFQLCQSIGMALQINSSQIVQTVYLYLNNDEGFLPYKGDLPLGLKSDDTLGTVVNKLKRQGVGNAGLPDQGTSPDHVHYWATYQQVSLVIIYNAPFADQQANIYAILVNH